MEKITQKWLPPICPLCYEYRLTWMYQSEWQNALWNNLSREIVRKLAQRCRVQPNFGKLIPYKPTKICHTPEKTIEFFTWSKITTKIWHFRAISCMCEKLNLLDFSRLLRFLLTFCHATPRFYPNPQKRKGTNFT